MTQALAPIRAGARPIAMVPQTFDELQRMATVFMKSKTFKPSYHAAKAAEDGDHEQAIAECCIVIQRGLDVGLSPTQAVEGIAIINGKTLIYGDTLTALLLAGGCKIKKWTEGAGSDMIGHAQIIRPDGETIEKSYSYAQADNAQLIDHRKTIRRKQWDKTKNKMDWMDVPNDAVWVRFTDRMLEWRAFGFAVKDGASDFSKGLSIVEEMSPEANDPAPPIDITPPPALPDIPDIFDERPDNIVTPKSDLLDDQNGFIDMLQSCLSAGEERRDIREVVLANYELTKRCTPDNRDKISTLYREALG